MRLTLRTLLAYLDNTLDPQDAEALRNKLSESGFATQLVQRIRATLENGSLPAPSPQAVGPVEDANVISEYLDSTLPTEQVAEIERACLESDPQLAEAAACHQILTMILGQPAEVSPELRQRVYELPDRKIEDIAASGSFSSLAIPTDQPELPPLTNEVPTADVTSAREGQPVQPVGFSDSGVSDAPTRLREAEQESLEQDSGAAVAGANPQRKNDPLFTGTVRTSRITPWLVSLALAGVLLFALSRIFQPLLNPRVAELDRSPGSTEIGSAEIGSAEIGSAEIEVPAEQAPVMSEVASDEAALPPPNVAPEDDITVGTEAETIQAEMEDRDDSGQSNRENDGDASTKVNTQDDVTTQDVGVTGDGPDKDASDPDVAVADAKSNVQPGDGEDAPPSAPDVARVPIEIAKVTSEETLLVGTDGQNLVRLKKDSVLPAGLAISCAPTFRGDMTVEDVSVTVVGPAEVVWLVGDNNAVTLEVKFGRILATATKADAQFNVLLGEEQIQLTLNEIGTVAAASLKHFRRPGFDPLQPQNRVPLAGVLSVQGQLKLAHQDQEVTLETGQQWVKRGATDAKVSPVEAVPKWIDTPDAGVANLESSARSGLLELLKGGQPLEVALREATLFRRTEVSALAAQTLLNLGRGDVYFGGDGILSEPKQRAYWPDHFESLLASVDRNVESAERLRDSIERMDSAHAEQLLRLLTGYSQKQLAEGGDQELVDLLDSTSMAVRVLALENLHRITGTTLYFRAEQENAVRRAPVIKKWVVRLRKGDIRWQE